MFASDGSLLDVLGCARFSIHLPPPLKIEKPRASVSVIRRQQSFTQPQQRACGFQPCSLFLLHLGAVKQKHSGLVLENNSQASVIF